MTTKITQRITPFLWFDDKAEEAATFYTSIFANSHAIQRKCVKVLRLTEVFRLSDLVLYANL